MCELADSHGEPLRKLVWIGAGRRDVDPYGLGGVFRESVALLVLQILIYRGRAIRESPLRYMMLPSWRGDSRIARSKAKSQFVAGRRGRRPLRRMCELADSRGEPLRKLVWIWNGTS